MSAIQSSLNLWVDSTGRFTGGSFPGSSAGRPALLGFDDGDLDSITSVISDCEEEGEVSPARDETDSHGSPIELVAEAIDTNSSEMGVSEEIIAAAAMHIGVIEAAMRQHQATGVINLADDDAGSNDFSSEGSFTELFLSQLLGNPRKAFAAITWKKHRMGLLALLL